MKISWPDLQNKSFFLSLTANLVHDLCQKCWPGLTLCIAADEFSKCLAAYDSAEWKKCIPQISSTLYSIGGFLVFSGFSYQDIGKISICSRRYVIEKIIPIQKNERNEYRYLVDSIRNYYSHDTFPHYLYDFWVCGWKLSKHSKLALL